MSMSETFQTGTPATRAGDGQFTAALIQATLTAKKVASIVALSWDGPQLRSYTVSLGLGEQPERVEQLSGALALAAGAESCRVAREAGRLLLEIPKPEGDRKPLRAGRLETLDPTDGDGGLRGHRDGRTAGVARPGRRTRRACRHRRHNGIRQIGAAALAAVSARGPERTCGAAYGAD